MRVYKRARGAESGMIHLNCTIRLKTVERGGSQEVRAEYYRYKITYFHSCYFFSLS